MARAEQRRSPARALAAQAFRDARVRTIVFAYLFVVYSCIQPVGYRHSFSTPQERLAFAHGFGENAGLGPSTGAPTT